MPVVVIGGGLTAIDTATEARAYYLVQIEKFIERYETLAAEIGEDAVRVVWSAEEKLIAAEFLDHARQVRAERQVAASEHRQPNFDALIAAWGGITIAYRRRLI